MDLCVLVQKELERLGNGKEASKTIAVMEADPEHGKHVAACNVTVWGTSIDVVALRGGSALRDAQLRDLTLNALYFNLNSRRVEDLTEFGLTDLRNGNIRTPIDPTLTLEYDPLRALRIARFFSQVASVSDIAETSRTIESSIDPALVAALSSESFRRNLASRTKRDRMGQEMKKGLSDSRGRGVFMIQLLARTGLWDTVLLGSDGLGTPNDFTAKLASDQCFAAEFLRQKYSVELPSNANSLVILMLGSFLFSIVDAGPRTLRVRESAVHHTLVRALRLGNSESDSVVLVMRGARELLEIESPNRLQLGLVLRMCGPLWPVAWLVAASSSTTPDSLVPLLRAVDEMGLLNVWNMKPMYNGNQISQIIQHSPGPGFARLSERLIEEQLCNPQLSPELAAQCLCEEAARIFS